MNQHPNHPSAVQANLKYQNGRTSLLLITGFSAINLVTLFFGSTYFLFSSYITQLISIIGSVFYEELGGSIPVLLVTFALGAISVLPYLLCWIFSKKHVGWMIAALALFSVDSLLLLFDMLTSLFGGFDISYLIDIAFHIWAIASLAIAVSYKLRAKNDAQEPAAVWEAEGAPSYTPASEEPVRNLVLTRTKKFSGSAVSYICALNGEEIGQISNGQTVSFPIGSGAYSFAVLTPQGASSNVITVEAGTEDVNLTLNSKMGFSEIHLYLERA